MIGLLRNDDAYGHISTPYDLLISKEDYLNNIPKTLFGICDFNGKDAADLGAGTGRLTTLVASLAHSVVAVDSAADMLRKTASKLTDLGLTNWRAVVSDYRRLPLDDRSVDVVMAGWSICYAGSSNNPGWQEDIRQVMREIDRVLRPNGTVIILETLGTGQETPMPPEYLLPYYQALEGPYGFQHTAIRTDYRFDSAEQAEQLCRDFFGDEAGDRIQQEGSAIVPECTGVWWRTKNGEPIV
ncbi:class I SAM-dependent methyltransferase [Cohnella sp. AR92]|uniref:class I SAM-dependent methyltransferase n=1 Tax=Cohnella sp. AR92 TaxID=648716 RepID=UPI001EDD68F1|nr:class I SAM-dependent methyltransferase [Cohnella sp. AR92]